MPGHSPDFRTTPENEKWLITLANHSVKMMEAPKGKADPSYLMARPCCWSRRGGAASDLQESICYKWHIPALGEGLIDSCLKFIETQNWNLLAETLLVEKLKPSNFSWRLGNQKFCYWCTLIRSHASFVPQFSYAWKKDYAFSHLQEAQLMSISKGLWDPWLGGARFGQNTVVSSSPWRGINP